MRSPSPGERGAITAEMMVALPILTAVIGVALSGVHAGLAQLNLDEEAALQARYASLGGEVEGAKEEGDLLCVELHKTLTGGLWAIDPLELQSTACALRPPRSG
mgnify:FL=1